MGTFDPHARPPVILEDNRTWRYAARVISWTDGDTCQADALIDLGFEQMVTRRLVCRLLGVNTPETRGTTGDVRERALHAKAFVSARWPGQVLAPVDDDGVQRVIRPGTPVLVDVLKWDKYAPRLDVHIGDMRGQDVTDALLAAGLGDPYDGGAR